MSAKNLSLVLLAALALGGAAIALNMFGGDPSNDAQAVEWVDDEDETGPAGTLTAEGENKRELARAQVSEVTPTAAEEDEDEPRPRIEVSGRVIGDNGAPVAGAKVSLHYRMSFDALRNRGDFGGGFGGGPGGPGGGPGGDRRFRQRAAGKPVLTDTEGRFSFAGQVYQTSNLELHVVHDQFAPAVVQRDWSSREGLLDIGDVVVGAGVTVSGFVVDTDNRPIAGAEVRFQSSNNGGGGMGGRGRGGMGGRGGQRDGETNTEARLEDLIAQAKSDQTGFFRIEHVPAGRFRLMARATKYLPGLSPSIEGKSGEQADAGKLQLTLGVELRGVVVDAQGKPVADARVEAGASFRRGGRDGGNAGAPAEAAPALAAAPAENRAPDWEALAMRMGNNRRTRTNDRGEFALDSLPPGELRLRVEHPRFVTEERQPIDAAKEPRVTVRLEPALVITGRVLDDTTGEPLGTFAIAARETDGGGGRGGNDPAQGRGRRGGQDAGNGGGRGRRGGGEATEEVPPEIAAARAAEEARRAQRENFLQQRLGPTGQAPRNPGRPKAWAGGQFTLPGQQPGRFVIDVMADDYIGVVAGPIELVKGQMPEPLTIRLRRGSKITGRVEDRVTREPLANVDVSLLLPIEDQPAANEAEQPWAMFRPREVGRRITRTRTDAAGRFTLRPQTSGEYWVRLDHEGYNQLLDRNVFVTDGRDLETPAYPLVPGSEVSGRILNPTPEKHYTVTLFAAGGQRRSARVQKDLTYRIDGIDPGSYWVLLNDGSNNEGGGGRRGMPTGVMSRMTEMARGNMQPDLVIGEGIKLRHDIDAGARAPGTVRGRVALNGLGAAGYDVSLSAPPSETDAANQPAQQGGGRRGGGMRGMMNRLLSEQTDAEGKFTLEGVPAGSYILEVRRGGGGGGRGGRGGRGGGGGATLHREPIVVTQGGIVERNLVFSTGAVAFEVATEADNKPIDRANIEMVLASEASGAAPEQWRSLASFTNAMVRNGTASLSDIKTGDWSYRIQAQGQAPVLGTAFVEQTATPTPIRLKLKPAAPPK